MTIHAIQSTSKHIELMIYQAIICATKPAQWVKIISTVPPCVFQILGVGMSVLEGVDPNPENFVSACVLHTRNMQVGCLMRLEPNKSAGVSTAV